MNPTGVSAIMAATTSAVLAGEHLPDVLSRLVGEAVSLLSADALGVLVSVDGHLDVLTASSHVAAELEVFEIQQDAGPCVDSVRDGTSVSCTGEADIVARWAHVGSAIVAAGYRQVRAFPLRWRGSSYGAMNVLRFDESDHADADALGQPLANLASIAVVQSGDLAADQVADRVRCALEAHSIIEQAKGVLAFRHRTDMAAAYARLVEHAEAADLTVTEAATDIVREAQRGAEGTEGTNDTA